MTNVIRIGKAHLVINIIDLNKKVIVLILPGGGYSILSNRESGPVATKFNMFGYNTAVLYYSCEKYTPLNEGEEAIRILSKEYENIFVIGFSAGGHLAGYLGTNEYLGNLKGMILCYPVVSFVEYVDFETANNLLGKDADIKERTKYSIEKRVSKNTVPTFIWTTRDDEDVPYENTVLLTQKLEEYGIYHKTIIFPHGRHGLALSDETAIVNGDLSFKNDEVAVWPNEANDFIKDVLNRTK